MKKTIFLALTTLIIAACGKQEKDYDATGTFEATEVTISAESSGQLISLNINEGDILNSGVTVGQIDSQQLVLKRQQLATNTQQLNATHSQLDANKRQLAANKLAMARKQLDLKKQVATIQQQIANRRVNQQVQNYKRCLKNSHFGVEKFNFSLGLSFNFFCMDIILLSV